MDMYFETAFDIDLLKIADKFASISDSFLITCMESTTITENDGGVIKNALEVWKTKICELFKQILETIKKFISNALVKIDTKVQQYELNKKLDEMKDLMAKKRSKIVNKQIDYFDIRKYKIYYTEFIDRYTSELKKGLNKDFKDVKEYEKWRIEMENKLADFNFKLTDEEQWKLSISINSAIKLSEEEARNREKNLKMIESESTSAIKKLESHYKKLDIERSFVNFKGEKLQIAKQRHSFIGIICSKLLQCMRTIVSLITKHTFAVITGIIVILIAL